MPVSNKRRTKTFSKKVSKKSLKNGGSKKRTHTMKNKQNKEKKQRKNNKMSGAGNALTAEEIEEILVPFYSMPEEKKKQAREALQKLAFDPNYRIDCFGTELPKNEEDELTLREQAESKVQCWNRYGDPIE
jgi:hypothetical protein